MIRILIVELNIFFTISNKKEGKQVHKQVATKATQFISFKMPTNVQNKDRKTRQVVQYVQFQKSSA